MLVGIWISLQRSFASSRGRQHGGDDGAYPLDRMPSELRERPAAATRGHDAVLRHPASPYVCDGCDCTFRTPYNNNCATQTNGLNGQQADDPDRDLPRHVRNVSPRRSSMMWRDLNGDSGSTTPATRRSSSPQRREHAPSVNRPIFQYVFPHRTAPTARRDTLTSANAKAGRRGEHRGRHRCQPGLTSRLRRSSSPRCVRAT